MIKKGELKKHEAMASIEAEFNLTVLSYDPFSSLHEGYALLLEEVDELWDEIKIKPEFRDLQKVRHEAKQVAAMALRIMVDLT